MTAALVVARTQVDSAVHRPCDGCQRERNSLERATEFAQDI